MQWTLRHACSATGVKRAGLSSGSCSSDVRELEICEVTTHLLENRLACLYIQCRQKILKRSSASTSLRFLELLKRSKEDVSAGRFLAACAHVVMGVAASTVCAAPCTKATRASRALQRKAADKVQESLPASGTFQRQDILDDVIPNHSNSPLLLV
mmetsp:Transcript_12377/g.23259  ORF Transcript_12377/g.23259 Transcript_12377/m.23259 type:complete len:155 (+) Transcript_12377:55-519(+)